MIRSISKEAGVSEEAVSLIVNNFFLAIRNIMYRNHDVNLFGLFKFKLRKFYRKKVDQNPNVNLRLRTDINVRKRIEAKRRKKK